jgi:hypothetical protein
MYERHVSNQLVSFLNDSTSSGGKDHLLLLHEEPEIGRLIEFHFLRIGLENGETSVYAMSDAESTEAIEQEMADFGIDVDKYKRSNLLRIFPTQNPFEHPDGLKVGIQMAIQKSLAGVPPPFRFTDRLFSTPLNKLEPNLTRSILDVESSFHQALHGQHISAKYLCSYSVDNIQDLLSYASGWTEALLKSHNGVIYSTFPSNLALRFD